MSWQKELYHHGILGQKWGVRRFQNKDGSLTSAGRKRYNSNEDSDTLALSARRKYRALAKFRETQEDIDKEIHRNPTKVNTKKFADDYVSAENMARFAFKEDEKIQTLLKQKYASIDYDFMVEAKTGELYVRSLLKNKLGETYISELYLGYKLPEKEAKKIKRDKVL